MRTLFEIIDSAKSGQKPAYEECYWAMLALVALHTFDSMSLSRLVEHPNSKFITPKSEFEESWRRAKTALNKSPKEWVGPNNDPANPDYQKMRNIGLKIIDKLIEKTEGKVEE